MSPSSRPTMHLVCLLSLWLTCLFFSGTLAELPLSPGSCSQRCESGVDEANATAAILHRCSCGSGCSVYKDCCFDSQHRSEDASVPESSRMCISLSTRGRFIAIVACSSTWQGSSEFCLESTGHLPPVTSATSGVTYSNRFCAVCNGDGERLTTWNVELRCCPEHDYLDGRRYVYDRGNLWSQVEGHEQCLCHYIPHHNDSSFADTLELRACDRSREIDRCSASWHDDAVQELCRSFLDPVYINDRVYRNIYCGQCNFERLGQVKCLPAVIESKLAQGSDLVSVFDYCTTHDLTTCLHYLDHLQRGRSYTFSSLLNVREESCVPPHGRRCCDGFRYDGRTQRCRQLIRNNRRHNHL